MDARPHPASDTKGTASAARSSVSLAKLAEIETQLALERSENARRLRDVETRFQGLRSTLLSMQDEIRRGTAERDRLRTQLAERTQEVESLRRDLDADGGTASASDVSLSRAQAEIQRLAERIRDLENESISSAESGPAGLEHVERLEAEVRRRDQALIAAAGKASAQEKAIASLEGKLDRARSQVAEVREALLAEKRSAAADRPGDEAAAPEQRLEETGDELDDVAARKAPRETAAAEGAAPAGSAVVEPASDGFPNAPGLRSEGVAEKFAFGVRFHARETQTRRAVDVLLLGRQLSELDGKRLDALLLARHVNLASALTFGVAKSGPYLVSERPVGETVEEWVRRVGALPERTALPVALQVARGLRQAAFHGALHGDLAPRFVRLTGTGRVQVEDVGIAGLVPAGDRAPRAPLYAAPERLRGSPPPDARSDIYSLGAILFLLLTGTAPYEGDRDAIVRAHAAGTPPGACSRNKDVPAEAAQLVAKMMAHDPDHRHLTWDQLLVDVEHRIARLAGDHDGAGSRRPMIEAMAAHPYLVATLASVPLVAVAAVLYLLGS